jgi:hypothetical protein
MTPVAISNVDQTLCANNKQIMFRGFFLHVQCAITFDAGGIGSPLVLADCK